MPALCLVEEGSGKNAGRAVLPHGEILSLEEKGTLGVYVYQKRDKPPKNRVVRTATQGPQNAMGTQWREPLVLPAGGRKASKRRYLTWMDV